MTHQSRQLFLLILFRISRSLSAGMIMLAFPYLVLTVLHYGALKLGLIYSAGAVASAVFGLLFGFLADLWGRKGTLILVGIMLPASALLVFLSGHLAMLFAASALGGYSATGSLMGGGVGGAAQPIQNALIADLTTVQTRTRIYSILTFLSGIFAAFGALLARYFATTEVFLVAALIALAGIVALAPLRAPRVRGNLRRLESKRTIGKFTITGLFNGLSQGLVMPLLIPFFVLVFHVPKERMAVFAFASGAMAALAILGAPWIEKRLGFVKGIAITRGLGAALLLFLPFSPDLWMALTIYILIPALRVVAIPVQQTALTEMVPRGETGRALGINQVGRLASSAGGIAIGGALFEVSEIALPFILYAVVVGTNLFLYFRFFRVNPVDERLKAV
jgi:MFS family permease